MATKEQDAFEKEQKDARVEQRAFDLLKADVARCGLVVCLRETIQNMPTSIEEAFHLAEKFEEAARARRR